VFFTVCACAAARSVFRHALAPTAAVAISLLLLLLLLS
jgi:hypothetical protein